MEMLVLQLAARARTEVGAFSVTPCSLEATTTRWHRQRVQAASATA